MFYSYGTISATPRIHVHLQHSMSPNPAMTAYRQLNLIPYQKNQVARPVSMAQYQYSNVQAPYSVSQISQLAQITQISQVPHMLPMMSQMSSGMQAPQLASIMQLSQTQVMNSTHPGFHQLKYNAAVLGPTTASNSMAVSEKQQEKTLQGQKVQDRLFSMYLNQGRASQDGAFVERAQQEKLKEQAKLELEEIDGETFPFSAIKIYNEYYDVYDDPETEDFIKFFDAGCELAEKITIRNQHRPCFRNSHNLCFRTRSEINHPFATLANIHSQGVPWATRDFLHVYVRLINCWHSIKGYLQVKDGSLGNIGRELNGKFRACYADWETNTRELCEHLIRIFSNLDSNVSNPAPLPSFLNCNRPKNAASQTSTTHKEIQNDDLKIAEMELDEPSKNDSVKYGNIKKKYSADSVCPTIEFYPTAHNIDHHYNNLDAQESFDDDKDWESALAACNNFSQMLQEPAEMLTSSEADWRRWFPKQEINQQNGMQSAIGGKMDKKTAQEHRLLAMAQQHAQQLILQQQIHQQMAHRQALFQPLYTPTQMLRDATKEKQVQRKTVLQPIGPPSGKVKSRLEYEMETMKKLVAKIGQTEFFKTLHSEIAGVSDCRIQLKTVIDKFDGKFYTVALDMLFDIDRFITSALDYFSRDLFILKQVDRFATSIDNFRKNNIFDLDFKENGRCID